MSVATFKASLAAANKAIVALHETDKQLRAAHAETTRERKHLISAIEPTDRVVANMERLVDDIAAKHRRDVGIAHMAAMSGSLRVNTSGLFEAVTVKDLAALMPEVSRKTSKRSSVHSQRATAYPSKNDRLHSRLSTRGWRRSNRSTPNWSRRLRHRASRSTTYPQSQNANAPKRDRKCASQQRVL